MTSVEMSLAMEGHIDVGPGELGCIWLRGADNLNRMEWREETRRWGTRSGNILLMLSLKSKGEETNFRFQVVDHSRKLSGGHVD
jgi:hypothetical protein